MRRARPESYGSITQLLEDTLERVARPALGEKLLECDEGKVADLAAASLGTRESRSARANDVAASHRVARADRSPRSLRSSTGRSAAVHTA